MKSKPSSTRQKPATRRTSPARTQTVRPARLKLSKILVPVDFSDCSIKALQYAIPFALQFDCSIVLVNVVELHYGGALYGPLDFPILEEDFQAESQKRLQKLADDCLKAKVRCRTQSLVGRPATAIVEVAKTSNADLIILATHGYSGLAHAWMGSTAEQVVRHAPCPVLTVREKEREFAIA